MNVVATDDPGVSRVGSAQNARTRFGGEARRTSLARALAVEPDLLLLDEPFAALDPATRASLVPELAARLRETQTAAVIVTHDATEAVALADRLLVLVDGRIARCDRTDVVLTQAAVPGMSVTGTG